MSNSLDAGYLAEVECPGGFCRYQNPALLNYVAAAAGYAPRPLRPGFRYLELGCGKGVTANVMAAASPQGEFWGVDVSAEHIAEARRQAEEAGLANITFVEQAFADLAGGDLPEFDFVTLHGVYARVPEPVRRDIRAALAAKLKPGGIAYVTYGAKPGRVAVEPLRRLLADLVGRHQGDLPARVEAGLRYLARLRDNEAQYFVQNPAASEALTGAMDSGVEVAIHQFLNDNWEPHYFGDVARDMAESGLVFAGQAATARNDLDLMLPDDLKSVVRELDDPLHMEQAKDFALNTGMRLDVYVKAQGPVPEAERAALFDGLIFGTTKSKKSIEREVQFPPGRLALSGKPYDEILASCSVVAHSMSEIRALETVRDYTGAQQLDALHYLVSAEQLAPFAAPSRFGTTSAPGGTGPQFAMYGGHNRRVIEGLRGDESDVLLASPTLGSGIELDLLAATVLQTLTAVGTERAPGRLWESLVSYGLGERISGWPAGAPNEQVPFTAKCLADFMEDRLVKLLDLGVLDFAGPS